MMRISAHAAQSREVLHGRANIERVEATHISQTNIGYRGRVTGYRSLIDEGVEVKSIAACLGPHVQDRRKVMIHAKCRQFLSVSTPEVFRSLGPNARRQVRQGG